MLPNPNFPSPAAAEFSLFSETKLSTLEREWLGAHDLDAALLVGAKMLLYIQKLELAQSGYHFSEDQDLLAA